MKLRATPMGYNDKASPTAAMLAGAPGWVLSAIRPLLGFASLTKYSKVSRCRILEFRGAEGSDHSLAALRRGINGSLPNVPSLHGLAAGSAPR